MSWLKGALKLKMLHSCICSSDFPVDVSHYHCCLCRKRMWWRVWITLMCAACWESAWHHQSSWLLSWCRTAACWTMSGTTGIALGRSGCSIGVSRLLRWVNEVSKTSSKEKLSCLRRQLSVQLSLSLLRPINANTRNRVLICLVRFKSDLDF